MKICVDTSVLIDILKDEYRRHQEKLYAAIQSRETLVAPAVVFAELMPQFQGDAGEVSSFLRDHKTGVAPLDVDAVKIAGSRWLKFLKRKSKMKCPHCGKQLDKREHFLSDFYIGGFALAKCDALLTRDRGIYRKYFRDLLLYDPKI